MKTPMVSLIIPCFNEEKFIRPLLESVLNQDYPNEKMELFILDGGSTDSTLEIIMHIYEQSPIVNL